MKKFYFTFGNSYDYPYQGGYLVVNAIDRDDAIEKYRRKYPDIHENTVNCAFIYTENEWKNINLGQSLCHEVIDCRFKFIEAKLASFRNQTQYLRSALSDAESAPALPGYLVPLHLQNLPRHPYPELEDDVSAHQ